MNVSGDRTRVGVRLFGSIAVEADGRMLGPRDFGGSRPKQVLEILLSARGSPVPVDHIAESLWGERLPANYAASIQTFVSTLRRHLYEDQSLAREIIVTERGAYRFAVERASVDIDRFDDLLEQAGRAATDPARRALLAALSLAVGEVLEDEPYAEWTQDLRGTYHGRVIGAHLEAAETALIARDFRAGLAHAQAVVRLDRLSERAHRTEMLALYAMGRTHEALEAYRRLRSLLVGELGLEPNAETRSLEAAILRQDEVSELLPRPAREMQLKASGQPWLLFLGRRAELAALGDVLESSLTGEFSLVLVEGEPGIGKSRLLDEFGSTLDGMRVGRARCSALEQHLTHVPLAAALRDVLDGLDLDTRELPALGGILPELAPRDRPADFGEVDVLEAVIEVIHRAAPLVLVFDDLHLADAGTVAALEYIRGRCTTSRVMVLGALRDHDTPLDHPLRRLAVTTTIRLEPLTDQELTPLGIPDVHTRTGGHPALVTTLIAGGSDPDLRGSAGELLMARCRAEGAESFRVLQTAATLPQAFEPELLADVLETEPVALVERLEQLCDRRILRVDGLRFRFRYAIVRDVLRAAVSPARDRLMRERTEMVKKRRTTLPAAGHDLTLVSTTSAGS